MIPLCVIVRQAGPVPTQRRWESRQNDRTREAVLYLHEHGGVPTSQAGLCRSRHSNMRCTCCMCILCFIALDPIIVSSCIPVLYLTQIILNRAMEIHMSMRPVVECWATSLLSPDIFRSNDMFVFSTCQTWIYWDYCESRCYMLFLCVNIFSWGTIYEASEYMWKLWGNAWNVFPTQRLETSFSFLEFGSISISCHDLLIVMKATDDWDPFPIKWSPQIFEL